LQIGFNQKLSIVSMQFVVLNIGKAGPKIVYVGQNMQGK